MAMAWRLPTQLATPGNLHHNDSKTPSFEASLSWCRTLAPDHLLPMSKSSTSTATDLSKPETIIDCATGHPEEPIKKIGWEGKVALIQCVKAMGIQKFVFYSIHNCDKHAEVPLMDIKFQRISSRSFRSFSENNSTKTPNSKESIVFNTGLKPIT
ncbi:hypothetical protein ACFX16_003820 [Malus domestica]